MAKLLPEEQELAILIEGTNHLARISITGNLNFKYFKKLEKLANDYPDTYKLIAEDKDQDGCVNHRVYTAPPRLVCGMRIPSHRTLTDEQHEANIERGKKLAESRKTKSGKKKS